MRARILVAAVALLALAAPAHAVTLMVNGDTPARYYQRLTDDFARRMPTPPGIVDLYLAQCPMFAPTETAGCSYRAEAAPNGRPAIYITVKGLSRATVRDDLAHEIGHVELDLMPTPGGYGILRDADRERFTAIWRRPSDLGWWDPLAPCSPPGKRVAFPAGADCGEPSAAAEWAAEAYRLCATGQWRSRWVEALLDYLPDRGWRDMIRPSNLREARAPIIATCGLIRDAALRP